MKSLLIVLLILSSVSAMADCDFSKIVTNPDGTRTYSKELHICVGQLVQDNANKAAQIADLKVANSDLHKAITLKDLTIVTDEQRIGKFSLALDRVMTRVDKADELRDRNYWLYFGLGILATGAAAYTAAKLTGH